MNELLATGSVADLELLTRLWMKTTGVLQTAFGNRLAQVLQEISTDDGPKLSWKDRYYLVTMLRSADRAMAERSAIALGKVGDASAIPHLRYQIKSISLSREQAHMREIAANSIVQIEARLAEAQAPSTLLRASEMPMDGETLLRATRTSEPDDAQVLLRSYDKPD